jgi:hypothetical protein
MDEPEGLNERREANGDMAARCRSAPVTRLAGNSVGHSFEPHPLFASFIEAAVKQSRLV